WLAATAAGAVGGAVAGGATGGLIGALTKDGESEEDAHVYAEGVRRGGSLVSVRAEDDRVDDVVATLERHGGQVAKARGIAYREQGWKQFDSSAEPYSRDQVLAERARYQSRPVAGEDRSFGTVDARDTTMADEPGRTTPPQGSASPSRF
ncbi:MAG: hypothetical protein KKG14_03765, partial [Alphaproteobacteria bacterium]|nr:hypothetical protein [Alphaproteobacteria bacterium]MBU2417798.1 hypothetical protein [Alphaproteobacteria bacterium]